MFWSEDGEAGNLAGFRYSRTMLQDIAVARMRQEF